MKKIFTVMIIALLILPMFSMFAPKAKADSAYFTDLVQLTPNPYHDRGAGWSPDSSKIVYSAFADSWYRHIWVMNRDGTNKQQLTFGTVVDEGPDYSPDGLKIVFTRYGLRGWGIHDIFIMNADGSGVPEQITSTGLARLNVRWSNDGQRLAFYYGGAGTTTNEIHIMNIDRTNEVTVASGTYPVMNAYWSPDDTKLVYSMDDGIWVVDTSPPYQKTRVFQTSLPTMYAVYSPDGKYIMYASGVYGQLQDLYLIDVSGNFIAQLTYDTKFGYGFDWSPDGQYVAYNSISSGNYDVWRAKIAGAFNAGAMVGNWKFDEGSGTIAHDSSGNGNDGVIHTATWTDGIVGKALHFNGVDSWVEVPNSPTLNGLSQITVEAWIREDSITAQLKGIVSKCDGWAPPTNAEYFLGTNENGKVFFETDHGTAIFSAQTTPLITEAGRWYHVAGTWSGDTYTIYVDGTPVLSGTCTPQTTLSNTLPVQIGRHGTWSWVYFKGVIDEVKIYNYGRTAEEILNDYTSVSPPAEPDWVSILEQAELRKTIYSLYYEKAFNDQWWRDRATEAIAKSEFYNPLEDAAEDLFGLLLPKVPEMSSYLSILGLAYDLNKMLLDLTSWAFNQGIADALLWASLMPPRYAIRDDLSSLINAVNAVISASEAQDTSALNIALEAERVASESLYRGSATYDDQILFAIRAPQFPPWPIGVKQRSYLVLRDHIIALRSSLEANYPQLTSLLGNQKSLPQVVNVPLQARESVPIVLNAYWEFNEACVTTVPAGAQVKAHMVVAPNSTNYNPLKVRGTVTLNVLKERPWWVWWGGLALYKSITVDVNLNPGESQDITCVFVPDEATSWTFEGHYITATFSGQDPVSETFYSDQSVRWKDSGGYAMENGYPPRLRVNGQAMRSATVVVSQETQGKLYLHVYDQNNNHVGMNYQTSQVELGIPQASYQDNGYGMITIGLPNTITEFRIVIDARYAEYPTENYSLTIIRITDMEISNAKTIDCSIQQTTKQEYAILFTGETLQTISWEYVFQDSRRGTILRISTDDKYFQFVAPGKDFGVRSDPKMTVLKNVIVICYDDSTMRLVAAAVVGRLESCAAVAWDKQTGKTYWLIDTPNWRGRNDCFAP